MVLKSMKEHERYMADFMKVYEELEYWGPGSEEDTLKALCCVPFEPKKILEVGSGKGLATVVLANNSKATITAVDNEIFALAQLNAKAQANDLSNRITTICASMAELPFDKACFDLIWAEGSAYIMGVTNALSQWQHLLVAGGVLVVSDLVWLTDTPSAKAKDFFALEYPDIQSVENRIAQMKAANYEVLDSFALGKEAWQNYYRPLANRIIELSTKLQETSVVNDITNELAVYNSCAGEYGYQFFILRKVS